MRMKIEPNKKYEVLTFKSEKDIRNYERILSKRNQRKLQYSSGYSPKYHKVVHELTIPKRTRIQKLKDHLNLSVLNV